jgi:hypothetical protein
VRVASKITRYYHRITLNSFQIMINLDVCNYELILQLIQIHQDQDMFLSLRSLFIKNRAHI